MTIGNGLSVAEGGGDVKHGRRNLAAWVAVFFFLLWVFFSHSHVGSFNDRSRMAAIESLVHRGTWIIDESAFSRTVDRILVDGHFYSDKPPVLTFIASRVYAVLHNVFRLALDAGWCDLDESPCHCRVYCDDNPDWAYYLLTLTLIGLPSALMLALFYHITGRLELDNGAALLLTGALGLATQVFPYSTVFNSHLPAAACLLTGFYALLCAREGGNTRRYLFVAGLMTGLATSFDLGIGLFFVAFFGYAAWGHRRRAWLYLLGGLIPLALMALLDYQIVGNPLPPYMHTQGYDYPGSRFTQTIAGNRSPDNVIIYGLRLLFGDHGLFAFNPVLLWAAGALIRALWGARRVMDGARGYAGRLRQTAALIGLTSGVFSLYFVISTDNFGGAAYGPRWYTVYIPLLFLFVAVEWTAMRTHARGYLFLALAAISFVNGYQGALNPWRAATPLLRLEYAAPERPAPVDMALSGVVYEELEPDLLTTLGTRRVDKRWFDARSCLIIPAGPMWLAVDAGTPLDPALAERSGLPSGGDLTSHVDLRPARDAYLEQLATSAWTSPVLVPVDAGSLTPVSLPVEFGGRFVLLGYELLTDPPTAGNEVVIITAWQNKRDWSHRWRSLFTCSIPKAASVANSMAWGSTQKACAPAMYYCTFIALPLPPTRYRDVTGCSWDCTIRKR